MLDDLCLDPHTQTELLKGIGGCLHADVERECAHREVTIDLPGRRLALNLPEDVKPPRVQELVAEIWNCQPSQIRIVTDVGPHRPLPQADLHMVKKPIGRRGSVMDSKKDSGICLLCWFF